MNEDREKAQRRAEIVHEASKWNVGGGIVVMALFPLAIPILVLTAVAALPLVLIPLAGALAAAVVAVPVLLLWGLGRRAIRALRPARTAEVGSPESRSGWAGSPPAGLHRS